MLRVLLENMLTLKELDSFCTERVSRHSDTPQIDTPHSRRRVSMSDYEWADLIDQQDRVRTLIDPTSLCFAAAYAMGRSMDDEIIAAVSGNALVEKLVQQPLLYLLHKR